MEEVQVSILQIEKQTLQGELKYQKVASYMKQLIY